MQATHLAVPVTPAGIYFHNARDAANKLIDEHPEVTRAEHKRAAMLHMHAKLICQKEWSRIAELAAIETFGRPWQFGDYKVSGIGREEFTEAKKALLRHYAHEQSHHDDLAAAHAAAATSRRIK